MNESERPHIPIELLVEFPSVFVFRVIAAWSETLIEDCRARAERTLGRELLTVDHAMSAQGRFCSVRLSVVVVQPSDVTEVYATLREIPNLRMLL